MIKIITLAFLLLIANRSFSCSCSSDSDLYGFYDVVSKNRTNIIAVIDSLSKKSERGYNEIGYFTVIDTINSAGYNIGDTISLKGQDGVNCNVILQNFEIGDTLILTINELYKSLDYCKKNYLKIINGLNENLTINSIKNKTIGIITSNNSNSLKEDLIIYPNPARGIINLKTGNLEVKNLEIVDPIGKQVFFLSDPLPNNFTINTGNLPSGIYMLLLETPNKVISKQIRVF